MTLPQQSISTEQPFPPHDPSHERTGSDVVKLSDVVLVTDQRVVGMNISVESLGAFIRQIEAEAQRVCADETDSYYITCQCALQPGELHIVTIGRQGPMDMARAQDVWRAICRLPAPQPIADLIIFQLRLAVNGGLPEYR